MRRVIRGWRLGVNELNQHNSSCCSWLEFFKDRLLSRASPRIALACAAIFRGGESWFLKILLFLSSQSFQQMAFGSHSQADWSRDFLDSLNGDRFIQDEKRSWIVWGRVVSWVRFIALSHTSLEKGQSRMIWSAVSSLSLQRGQWEGPSMPLFLRLSPVRILLWAIDQQKISIFGMKVFDHIKFQATGLGAA